MAAPSAAAEPSSKGQTALRLLALALLFSVAAIYESTQLTALSTPNVWIHLRSGTWILENHAIPRVGLFSQYSNLPWNDSSWGFDAGLGVLYRVFGLRALPILLMGFKVALAVVSFRLARVGQARFWSAVVLSALAQYLLSGLQPVPQAFSMLFFAIELQLLIHCRQSGTARRLFWLPLLFVLWANLHIQFIAGLLLLGLFLFSLSIEQALRNMSASWMSHRISAVSLARVGGVTLLSLLATLVTPYTSRLLPTAFETLYSSVSFVHFSEMSAMSFRRPQEFTLMLAVMVAFLFLGRRRSLDLFELLVLLAATLVAFRIQRDAWMAVFAAICVISRGLAGVRDEKEWLVRADPIWQRILPAVLALTLVAIAAVRVPNRNMLNKISQNFPLKACDYLLQNHLPQPIFNAYSWGSFLTWYLPQYPVAVDSRVELYGDTILSEYFDVVGGKELLESHPMVSRAGTLLLERQSGMAKALTTLPALRSQYRLAYSDDLASVFVPQRAGP